jgi:hypothetical protein
VRTRVEDLAGRRKQGRSIEKPGGLRPRSPVWAAAIAVAAGAIVLLGLTGCAKMDSALGRQWIVVSFKPDTSVETALHVRAACSHIQNTPPLALPANHSPINIMYGVRYDTTNSSPANMSQLQTCLQKYESVIAGLDPQNAADEGG